MYVVASAMVGYVPGSAGGQERRKRKPLWMYESALIFARKKRAEEVPHTNSNCHNPALHFLLT